MKPGDRTVAAPQVHAAAVAIGVAMACTWALGAIGFLFGLHITRADGVLGTALALAFLACTSKDPRATCRAALVAVAAVAASLLVSSVAFDRTWDGWWYHQPGAMAMALGWNPVHEPLFHVWWSEHGSAFGYPSSAPLPQGIWNTFYPKASWILAAQPLLWDLPLDAGKFPALLLIFVAGVAAYRALRMLEVSSAWAMTLAVIAALNPVAVAQANSYYVDGMLGSCLAILVFSLISFDRGSSVPDLVLAVAAALIACNLKFTGLVYVGLILLVPLAYWAVRGKLAGRHRVVVAVGAVALLAGSVNPYLTNFEIAGSPFHPLNRIELMRGQMDPAFVEKNRAVKFLISLTYSNALGHDEPLAAARPLRDRGWGELRRFVTEADLRIGGFGPLFAFPLALSMFAAGQAPRRLSKAPGLALITLGVVASIVVNPEFWWARYAPQMWLLPVLAVALATKQRHAVLAASITGCLAITSLVCVVGWTATTALSTWRFSRAMHGIRTGAFHASAQEANPEFLPALSYRLKQNGIALEISDIQCDKPIRLAWVQGCP
jgi:hypothetical protein